MNILYLGASHFPYGGSSARLMHMTARALVSAGNEVTIILPRSWSPGPKSYRLDDIDVKCSWVPSKDTRTTAQEVIGLAASRYYFAKNLMKVLFENRFDWVIQTSVGLDLCLPMLPLHLISKLASQYGDIRDKRYIGNIFRYYNLSMGDQISGSLSKVVLNCGSKNLNDYYKKIAPGATIVNMAHPVDVDIFAKADGKQFRRHHNLEDFELVVYGGSLRYIEGIDDLGQATELLMHDNNKLRLVIASASSESELDKYSVFKKGTEVRKRTVFLGSLSINEVAALFSSADVLVLPKIDHPINRSATPIKLVEYMASGKAIICSSIGGVNDLVNHGENALLYEPGDWRTLSSLIGKVLRNRSLANQLGSSAQKKAFERYDIRVIGRMITDALSNN